MSEYIITCDDEVALWVGNDVESMRPLVCCRDCKYYSDSEWIIATDVEHVCHFWHGKPTKVEPDGFCAWAERRLEDE